MNRVAFEHMLKQRASRRNVLGAGGAVGAAGLIGVSFRGSPTRMYARQATPAGSPVASPVATPAASPIAEQPSLLLRPSARFGAYPFQLGVASGDPDAQSVVLWTRLAPSPIDGGGMDGLPYDVSWEVALDERFGRIVQRGVAVADPNLAHSVHVDVTGLQPATEYFYRFMVGS
ncbi:MAG TPA: PhoD-like phosphatase N-terminal domain-containing protein, partial [Thermomicrobiales bacterium]|nr:PhoD-like phosphatase N-terminal domain-containing protein [Thermomicrobiales bacterium]